MVGEELLDDAQLFETDRRSRLAASCNTQNLMVFVDDAIRIAPLLAPPMRASWPNRSCTTMTPAFVQTAATAA